LLVKDRGDSSLTIRAEFKVWGRHDYREVPEKPLKYFTDGERVGAVIMINPNKRKNINDEYRQNVIKSNTSFKHIFDNPFEGDGIPSHFVTAHENRGNCVEILHIVINRQGPFAVKELPGSGI